MDAADVDAFAATCANATGYRGAASAALQHPAQSDAPIHAHTIAIAPNARIG
ncbi:MAG TPA: hypothetical protein VGH68_01715 [Paraburkholderia sp.]|jgi:hypothetical protein